MPHAVTSDILAAFRAEPSMNVPSSRRATVLEDQLGFVSHLGWKGQLTNFKEDVRGSVH